MAPVAGFAFKVRVNGTLYTCTNYRVVSKVTGQDITNSEGTTGLGVAAVPGYETRVAGNAAAEVTVTNASFDPNEDPFAAPRFVARGAFLAVRIYVNGLSGVFWNFPSLLVTSIEHAGDAKGLQPITFTGETDGSYSEPT